MSNTWKFTHNLLSDNLNITSTDASMAIITIKKGKKGGSVKFILNK